MEVHKKQRTCIMCRKTDTKSQFIRIVRTPDGEVVFDPTGKANGRGAYVCGLACFERAVQGRKFDKALRTSISQEDYEALARDAVSKLLD